VTVADALRSCARSLRGSSESPLADARRLLVHALGRDPAWLIAHARDAIDGAAHAGLNALVARRAAGEPIAYVLGSAWFYGREFAVTPDVLVPRPETEHLVDAALDDLRAQRARAAVRGLHVCDVGTGCGAIALTLAAEDPSLAVVASDVSEAALAVARRNAELLGIAGRVRFVQGDLAEPLAPLGPFDCVVANLPYIPSAAVPSPPDPVGFEPRLALDGGDDGLALYRRLLFGLRRLVTPGGSAFLEAAPGTIERLAVLAESMLGAHVEIGEDYAGKERWLSVTP
jgi:release factor glutamine methyltransferase